ncbi:hypothetical protein L1080_028300 [Rhodococcus sp. MSC1_016]|uniref:hypothetical protein n=1 Tax=Rhodococcus sp. MSC1_016 TaxID=2909266 RepID=UPI00202E885B|nr:hypothetical protein [Rhodococcus sp. MSC1_016]
MAARAASGLAGGQGIVDAEVHGVGVDRVDVADAFEFEGQRAPGADVLPQDRAQSAGDRHRHRGRAAAAAIDSSIISRAWTNWAVPR